jgi:hypothetical protein
MNRSTRPFALSLVAAFILVTTKPAECYSNATSYFGRAKYIEYMAGDLPVILSAPHGGYLTPSEIPDRTPANCGGSTYFYAGGDYMTKELALAMRQAFFNATGRWPHVIINHLARVKLDANRDELAAACSDPEAQIAWREYPRIHRRCEGGSRRAVRNRVSGRRARPRPYNPADRDRHADKGGQTPLV